ncbi:DUF4340 domain-containing protein [Clostridium bowmanii]|uniref:DUF4340 domain-containing protein n=1 Tax=Clostridium bowmanii TaxID=132925 RepID=UPI001C0B5CDA|nr:DUF4340 domain-containing protein [Clostridium bowmanii]MBU3191038.1 DUF4340 domain-containing protein [Clostridium bowmanii]MCA1075362.1 DUF4340 domain-containing protein [Clostridium bowmanii]
MKKSKSIIILVVILLLLSGAYFYVSKHPKTKDADKSSISDVASTVELWEVDDTKVSKVIATFGDGSNTFIKKNKNWSIDNYDYKLDQPMITSAIGSLINSHGTLVEKNTEDIEKYGLIKPIINLIIVGDGSDKILNIGDKTSEGTNYYASGNEKKDVYSISVSTVDNIIKAQSAYRDKTITSINPETLTSIKIIEAGSSPIEIEKNENRSVEETNYNLNTWTLSGAYSKTIGVDDNKIGLVAAAIPKLTASDVIIDNPKDLSIYGLDKPSLELILKDSKSTLQLFIGKNKDDKYVYFKTSEADTIYVMDKTVIDTFRVKPLDIISKFVYIVNIDKVDKIVVVANGMETTVLLSRTSTKAEKSGDPDVVVTTSKVNDKIIEIKKFKKVYQEIVGLTVDSENDKKQEEKPAVSITYTLNNAKKKKEVINFVPYNNQFYAVFRDGKSDFVISLDKVNKMLTSLKNIK